MTHHATAYRFNQIFATRQTLGSRVELSARQGARARPNEWSPTNRQADADHQNRNQTQRDVSQYRSGTFH